MSNAPLAPEGTLVVIEGGPYGVASREALTGPGVVRFSDEVKAQDGDVAIYKGPHPTLHDWHLVHLSTLTDGTELLAPLSEGMFRVLPAEDGPEVSTTA